jgi:hypothetical protein
MNESLRLATTDINDWFMDDADDVDHKIPHVILNDKLMTDALFGTVVPIKAEHSYSLTSDGDSMPDSPSDASKIEGKKFNYLFFWISHFTCICRRCTMWVRILLKQNKIFVMLMKLCNNANTNDVNA